MTLEKYWQKRTPPSILMHYVYILKNNKTKQFYIGYTSDLKRRIVEHKKQKDVRLIYYEVYQKKGQAGLREQRLKLYGSAWRALKKRIIA